MQKQLKQKRPTDINRTAHLLVELSTESEQLEPVRSPPAGLSQYMAAIGRKGGKIGGKRRLKTMTAEERRKVAVKAAKTRWKTAKQKPLS